VSHNEILPTLSRNPVKAFFEGAQLSLRAFGYLLTHPQLWLMVVIPLVLNVLIFAGVLWWGFSSFSTMFYGWLEGREGWYWEALLWIAKLLYWVVVLFVVYFIFTPVALIIAAPFNDRLAESVERCFGFQINDNRSLLRMLVGETLYILFSELKRMGVISSVFVFLLPLNLVPVVGSILYFVMSFLWAGWCSAWEFTGFAGDRRHLRLSVKWGLLRQNFFASAGFGLVTAGLMMLPFVNVLTVPVSAVAGTLLFGMISNSRRTP
jgi:CysZ protein